MIVYLHFACPKGKKNVFSVLRSGFANRHELYTVLKVCISFVLIWLCNLFVLWEGILLWVSAYVEDEQYEEEQQDDLNADDEQLREEVSQHRLQRAHAWYGQKHIIHNWLIKSDWTVQ